MSHTAWHAEKLKTVGCSAISGHANNIDIQFKTAGYGKPYPAVFCP